ncbi:Lrp/AsnC family transcriptional regulator [Nesterenkonia populi]
MKMMEALHVDGRASWQRIAHALGVNERTVARRGNALLESATVQVVAIGLPALGHVVALRCGHGQARMTSRALSQHAASHWAHVTTGDFDVVAEITAESQEETSFLLEELPAVAGIRDIRTYPVIEYLRLARWWNLGILSAHERAAIRTSAGLSSNQHIGTTENLTDRDQALLQALELDGRMSYEELGRRTGTSDVTAKRRLDALRREGVIAIRAVIDPEALGLGTETLTWLDVPPRHLETVAEGIRRSEHIKYASRIAGPWDFILKNHVRDRTATDEVLPDEPWVEHITSMNISVALRTDKRSMVPTSPR